MELELRVTWTYLAGQFCVIVLPIATGSQTHTWPMQPLVGAACRPCLLLSVLLDREKGLVLTRSQPATEPPLASPDTRLASANAIWDLPGGERDHGTAGQKGSQEVAAAQEGFQALVALVCGHLSGLEQVRSYFRVSNWLLCNHSDPISHQQTAPT